MKKYSAMISAVIKKNYWDNFFKNIISAFRKLNLRVYLLNPVLIAVVFFVLIIYTNYRMSSSLKAQIIANQVKNDQAIEGLSSQISKIDSKNNQEKVLGDKKEEILLVDPTKLSPPLYSKKNLVLSAIVASQGETYCLINDKILKEGDKLEQYKVVLITQNYILISDHEKNTFKLQLN